MATKEEMIASVNTYLNKLLALFARSSGNKDDVLFVNNTDGKFAFDAGPVVANGQIATTASEVTRAKAAIVANPAALGNLLINQVNRSIERLDVATGVWSSTTSDYFTVYVKQERIYYSSWSNFIWIADKYGLFKRLLTSGLTPVG